MLIARAVELHFCGGQGALAYWSVRIAFLFGTLPFFCGSYFVCEYITALFMETGKFEKLPKRLLWGFIVPCIVASVFVTGQLFGGFYYFDEHNYCQMGPLYPILVILPYISISILGSFVIQHRKMISRKLLYSICNFWILPAVGELLTHYVAELPFTDWCMWGAAVMFFGRALSEQSEELAAAADTEAATGLPNTFGYLHEVEKIINYQNITDYCGYYFDIVRMSHINNKFGKKMGDDIIFHYAMAIKETLEPDEILGRLGGNFFVALVKKSNTEKFLNLLKDVTVEIEFHGKMEQVHIAAVAGGYEIKKKNIAAGQILTNCATAVSYAKNVAHKPYVFLDEELEKEFDHIRVMEEKARKALEMKEFEPFYQPKVNTENNTLCGAEALARWRHEGVLISPAEFVPIMEKNGTVCDLDFYILHQVCQDVKEWLAKGLEPVRVSVNFSRKNLGNPILAEAISKVVEQYDIPKDLIQIEVTETIDEFPLSYLIGVVEALQRYGMTVAIDDFGTGSSSIRLLKDVNFDVLKVDKSFVDYENEKDRELLGDIIRMAKNRKIDVIAEGVEKKRQVEELKAMDCFAIQGYVFDRPLEKKVFEQRLMSKNYELSEWL